MINMLQICNDFSDEDSENFVREVLQLYGEMYVHKNNNVIRDLLAFIYYYAINQLGIAGLQKVKEEDIKALEMVKHYLEAK